jgi:hypothetical protein
MHDDVYKLWMLLQIHKELIGHPKLANLRKQIDDELQKMNAEVPAPAPAAPPPIYPVDSGIQQTDTENRLGETEDGATGDDSEAGSDLTKRRV